MTNMARDYQRIERVIHYLNAHYTEQPSLEVLASAAGLSPGHFQRKFTDWVGVSPKSFLQHLTFEAARARLRRGVSIEEAAWTAGLSGPSRLHDLCVVLEAASPGEIKRGGAGLRITFGIGYTPFGRCLLGISERGIMHLGFVDNGETAAITAMRNSWPQAEYLRNDQTTGQVMEKVFRRQSFPRLPLRAYVQGTKFQLRVWRALLNVAPGSLVTYGQLAADIGRPAASRAVGVAIGANPLAYLIPCHRVIRATGALGGYHWGQGRKHIMLASETARAV